MVAANPKPSVLVDMQTVSNPRTITLFTSSLLVPMAAFMLYPFLIIYFTHVLRFSATEAGLLLSLRFLSSGLLGFLGGLLSARIGLARTYRAAGLLTGLTVLGMAFVTNVWGLLGLLVLLGVSASTVNAMARGLANTQVDAAQSGLVQNMIHWLNNVGMAAALPISALLLQGGYSRWPFYLTAVAYLSMALVMGRMFHTPMPADAPATRANEGVRPVGPWTILRHDRAFVWLVLSFLLVVVVEMQFESGVPLDLSYHFPHGARLFGILGLLDMVVVIVLQLVVSQWLARQPSPWPGYLGIVAVGGLILGGVWQTVVGWTAAVILLGVGDVFAYGQIFTLVGVVVKAGQEGQYFSLLTMVQGLATFLAYAAGSEVYQALHPLWLFALTLPLAVLAAVAYRNARTLHRQASAPNG